MTGVWSSSFLRAGRRTGVFLFFLFLGAATANFLHYFYKGMISSVYNSKDKRERWEIETETIKSVRYPRISDRVSPFFRGFGGQEDREELKFINS